MALELGRTGRSRNPRSCASPNEPIVVDARLSPNWGRAAPVTDLCVVVGVCIGIEERLRARRIWKKYREAWDGEWHRNGFRRLVTTVRTKGGRCGRGTWSFATDVGGDRSVGIEVTR